MKIDLDDYLSSAEAAKAIGCCARTMWTAVDRVGRDKVMIILFGKALIRKDKIDLIRSHTYQAGTERREKMAKIWGAAGGTTKAKNRAAKRSS